MTLGSAWILALPFVLAQEPEPEPVRWEGSVRDGLAEVRRLIEEERDPPAARALARALLEPDALARWRAQLDDSTGGTSERLLAPVEPLLEAFGAGGPPERARAEVHYALGLVEAAAGELESADRELGRAGALAGPGTLRLEALYDRGALALSVAEALREEVPEIRERLGLPPRGPAGTGPAGAPGTPGAPGSPAEPEEDRSLDLAEAAYRRAKELLIERLRADWRDQDPRANLELVQRRLRELEEIRREREQQESPQPDPQSGEPQDEEQEPQDEPGEGQQESQEDESQGQEGEPEDSGEERPEEQPPEPEPDREPGEETPEPEGESPEESQEQDAADAEPEGEPEERLLTREEVLRLLDRLAQLDEQAEALRARLRERRRVPVERDW